MKRYTYSPEEKEKLDRLEEDLQGLIQARNDFAVESCLSDDPAEAESFREAARATEAKANVVSAQIAEMEKLTWRQS